MMQLCAVVTPCDGRRVTVKQDDRREGGTVGSQDWSIKLVQPLIDVLQRNQIETLRGS